MIFYDEEVSAADQDEQSSSSSALTYEDIYNAVYNGYMDAYTEIKIEEAEQKELEEETTSENAQRVIVDNFPTYQNVRVNNFDSIDFSTITDAMESEQSENANIVEFASSTDSKLYTATTSSSPVTTGEQTVAYILDIRNILLLFLLVWFSIYLVNMIKKTVLKFMKGREDNE